jgi:hypothetical protein
MLGEVTATAGLRDKLFIATKLESPGSQELKLARLNTCIPASRMRDQPRVCS